LYPFTCSVKFILPHVQKDQFQVKAGPEHEHVALQFDLSDPTGGKGVTNGHQTDRLGTGFIPHHVHHVLMQFQIATAVDDLGKNSTTPK